MAAHAKIGDIIEIQTPSGLAYAQLTHIYNDPPKYGHLLRILEGLYEKRPDDLETLAAQPVQFQTFFPLNAALNRGIVANIGNVAVPPPWDAFPLFRVKGLVDPITRKAKKWALWDGAEEHMLNRPLTANERKLPILSVVNDSMLIERIVVGWRPENDIHT